MKRLILDFDDLHWASPENCIDTIDEIVAEQPNVKLSFFTVAKLRGFPIAQDYQWVKRIKRHIDNGNVCLGVHGLLHTTEEFKHKTYEETKSAIIQAELEFFMADLPFERVFKGPHWGINEAAYKALAELGYTHIYTHEDYEHITHPSITNVIYNWNLKDDYTEVLFDVVGHGHTHNVCENGIAEVKHRIVSASRIGLQHAFIHEF